MTSETDPDPTGTEPCQHHWVIETANGSVSPGECQVCHEVRDFKNSIEWRRWQTKRGTPAST
jgi:hypothetical protein